MIIASENKYTLGDSIKLINIVKVKIALLVYILILTKFLLYKNGIPLLKRLIFKMEIRIGKTSTVTHIWAKTCEITISKCDSIYEKHIANNTVANVRKL